MVNSKKALIGVSVYSLILSIAVSCTSASKKDTQESPIDTLKTAELKSVAPPTNAQSSVSENESSILEGQWSDVDPKDPGPGSYSILFKQDGGCRITVSASWWDGSWDFSSADSVLTLTMAQYDDKGKTGLTINHDYKLAEFTSEHVKLVYDGKEFPNFSGSYWKSPAQPK
jgi:hypothetical protein